MAFRFNWPEFDSDFYDEARSQLEAALNKGNKPKNIVDHITVKELHMGSKAPELEILEIGELSTDKFRGIFKLTYAGDAHIVLQTKVQANPMHTRLSELPKHTRPNILAADRPLVVPMLLRISHLKLRGIVVLVVSKTKGITLVFKNDPLESIVISSTFDSVTSVRSFLQREIEKQLRNLFQEDLPIMIHNLSLRRIQSEQERQKKQQQEECLKQKQLRKLQRDRANARSPPMSVFSDPGVQIPSVSMKMRSAMTSPPTEVCDCTSMPDLLTSRPRLHSDSPTTMSTAGLSPNYLAETDCLSCIHCDRQKHTLLDDYLIPSDRSVAAASSVRHGQAPITAANLSTLNYLYGNRFAGLHGPNPLYTEYASHALMGGARFPRYEAPMPDMYDFSVSGYESSSSSGHQSPPLDDAYDGQFMNDADAPWYVTDGPDLPSHLGNQHVTLPLDQEIVLDPVDNAYAAKLAELATSNHTISPFSHAIDHFTYRSVPYSAKKVGARPRHQKIPKRRIIHFPIPTQHS